MIWKSELIDVSGDEEIVHDALAKIGYEVAKEDNVWLLTHPKYADLKTAGEVHKDTEVVVERLLRMAALEGIDIEAKVGSVRRVNPDGSTNKTVFAKLSASLTLKGHAAAVVIQNPNISEEERQRLREEAEKRQAEKEREVLLTRISAAIQDSSILEVSELIDKADLSMTEAGHIIDIVQDACSGNLSSLAREAELSRFKRSINHPEVMGLAARHAVTNVDPPPKPMTEDEARSFAKGIGKGWLNQVEIDT